MIAAKMVNVNVNELSGAPLNWLIGERVCGGLPVRQVTRHGVTFMEKFTPDYCGDWDAATPVITRYSDLLINRMGFSCAVQPEEDSRVIAMRTIADFHVGPVAAVPAALLEVDQ